MTPKKVIFVVGSGPMIGSHVASLFASKSFSHIALFARSTDNLSKNSSFITSQPSFASVHTYSADVTDHIALKTALEKAIVDTGPPEVVIYNAARINYGTIGQYTHSDIVEDFKICNLGLYTTITTLLPYLQDLANSDPTAHPALFVTSSLLIEQPFAPVFSLSMAKAAQANLMKLIAEENKNVVHVALVTAGGPVSPEEEVNNPGNIATKFWELYEQEKGNWEFEKKCGW